MIYMLMYYVVFAYVVTGIWLGYDLAKEKQMKKKDNR